MKESSTQWKILNKLIESGTQSTIVNFLDTMGASKTARTISRLSVKEQHLLFAILSPEDAADPIEGIPESQAADLVENMPSKGKGGQIFA